jgi:hypothetical protein
VTPWPREAIYQCLALRQMSHQGYLTDATLGLQ